LSAVTELSAGAQISVVSGELAGVWAEESQFLPKRTRPAGRRRGRPCAPVDSPALSGFALRQLMRDFREVLEPGRALGQVTLE